MDVAFVPVFWLHQQVWGCQKKVVTRTVLKSSLAITWFAKSHIPSNIQAGGPSRMIDRWRPTVQTLSLLYLFHHSRQPREGRGSPLGWAVWFLYLLWLGALSHCTSPDLAEPSCSSWLQKWGLLVCSLLQAKWAIPRLSVPRESSSWQEHSDSYFSLAVINAQHLLQCPIYCSVPSRSLFSMIYKLISRHFPWLPTLAL